MPWVQKPCILCKELTYGSKWCRSCYIGGKKILAKKNLKKRFWTHVKKTDGCWFWTGCKNQQGYGLININRISRLAPRVSYQLICGKIPDGLYILHRCDTPACVNPKHIYPGTQAENMRDASVRGRMNPPKKLTQSQVNGIRCNYDFKRGTKTKMAKKLGVCLATIRLILENKRWRTNGIETSRQRPSIS